MNNEAELDRASKAERLLADPMIAEAFEHVRAEILKRIESAPLRDKDGVHELRLMLKLLRDVRGNLEQAVQNGKVASFRIQEEKRRFKFF